MKSGNVCQRGTRNKGGDNNIPRELIFLSFITIDITPSERHCRQVVIATTRRLTASVSFADVGDICLGGGEDKVKMMYLRVDFT